MKLRLSSSGAKDDCDLDYLAINTSDSEGSAPSTAPTPKATAAPTTKPTSAPTTAAPTQKPTTTPTTAPTQKPTSAPTTKPTSAPTTKPTSAPTTAPTQKPTTAPTQKPTTAPTTKPTTAPTTAPTTKPTSAPTTAPTAPGGRLCPAGQVWAPAPGTTWQWQLTGTIDQSWDVQMYDIDLFDTSASVISALHSKGRAVVSDFIIIIHYYYLDLFRSATLAPSTRTGVQMQASLLLTFLETTLTTGQERE